MTRYVVAVRRERQGMGVTTDALRLVDGVVFRSGNNQRAIIEAGPDLAQSLRCRFGDDLIIEAEIGHEPNYR